MARYTCIKTLEGSRTYKKGNKYSVANEPEEIAGRMWFKVEMNEDYTGGGMIAADSINEYFRRLLLKP